MKVLTIPFGKQRTSVPILSLREIARIALSWLYFRLLWSERVGNIHDAKTSSKDKLPNGDSAPRILTPRLSSLGLAARSPNRESSPHVYFQAVTPRFGNQILSLARLHHETLNLPTAGRIFLSPSNRYRESQFEWHDGRTHVCASSLSTAPSPFSTVLYHNSFVLSQSSADITSDIRAARAAILKMVRLPKKIDIPDSTLTIHVRGGDIFSRNPHPEYIPAPLAFYVRVIESSNCNHVRVVTEDHNPIAGRLLEWLRKKRVDYSLTVGSVDEALAVLFSSRNIVASHGSFVPAIAFLSDSIRRVFAFSQDPFMTLPPMEAAVEDVPGDWTDYRQKIGIWKATSDQIDLATSWDRAWAS